MDELDKKLYYDLNLEVKIPSKLNKVIKEELQRERKKITHRSFSKIAITACASLLVTTGIAYAGTVLTNNIWKEPEKVISNTEYQEVSKKENSGKKVSEEEVREKASEALELFGHENEKIELVELKRNVNDYNSVWKVKTNKGTLMDFSADDNSYFSIGCEVDQKAKKLQKCEITKEEAEKRARELCKEQGYNLEKYNKILVEPYLQWNDWQEVNSKASQWNVTFSKTYHNGINSYENIRMEFISGIDSIEVYFFSIENVVYENNPVEITEEIAKQIVLDTEKKINAEYKIKNIYTNLDMALMNGNAHQRTTNYEQYCKQYYRQNSVTTFEEEYVSYRTERRVRRGWMVTIECEGITETGEPSDPYYTYYIDATTGEIIGGNPIYYMIKLQSQ